MRKLAALSAMLLTTLCHGAQWKDTLVISDRVIAIHLDEMDSVRLPTLGNGKNGALETSPLDVAKAAKADNYTVDGIPPKATGRKTRPHTFVSVGGGEKHALEHFIYLELTRPLEPGRQITITLDPSLLSGGPATQQMTFDPRVTRSEAIQTNQLGYLPAGQKIAYVSTWMGDLGGASFPEGASFHVIDQKTGSPVFTGKLALRKKNSEPDSGQAHEQNHYRTDLYECDFTAFQQAGSFALSIDGVGRSYPFTISPHIYRQAYITTIRGMYHQRCGTELKAPFTEWVRPICHDPSVDPLRQTDHRYLDAPFSDGPTRNVPFKETGELRKDVFGGWHDAGDWDREDNHIDIPSRLLLAYELTPTHYADGDLNIPESGNGIPDLIDEARWGVDHYLRLQRPDGGVSVGMFESGWPKIGQTSWTDSLIKYCYAEDPMATYRHAAAAAHLARVLRTIGRPDEAAPYADSAIRAWQWASAEARAADAPRVRDDRLHAAAALYRLTGDAVYQQRFEVDCLVKKPDDRLFVYEKYEQSLGTWTMAFAPDDLPGLNKPLRDLMRQASINYARSTAVQPSEKRGNRRGYDWYHPLNWGRGSQTDNFSLMVAHKLTGEGTFLDVMIANANLTLGANPLNKTWVTHLGHRSPKQVMQINYWYDEKGPNPGVTPIGPTAYSDNLPAAGTWLPGYAMKFVYPAAKEWPPLELWFENRLCPPTNEFVVSNQATTGSSFGYLSAPAAR